MYDDDVLATPRKRTVTPQVEATGEVVAEEAVSGFCGLVVACAADSVTLEDRHGRRRVFPLLPGGFLIDGRTVTLTRPSPTAPTRPTRSASGSTLVTGHTARVARAARIYVEGAHDAALVERVWGHDLRVEGVAVEYLEGVDDLENIVTAFGPGPTRRLGVLVDHLVPGSKESRIAARVTGDHVLICGHPFIDIWQAVKPSAIGIPAWPHVPKGTPWKEGVITALGWRTDTAEAWRRILGSVRDYRDLEPQLLGRVEELIDFVTT